MSTSTMLSTAWCFLPLLFGLTTSASNRRCFPLYEGGSSCFIRPDPPVLLSWSSAMQYCKNIGATLPITDSSHSNSIYRNAIGYFGLHSETLWLGANLTYDPNNWFWTTGSRFTGTIEDRNIQGKSHAYIMGNGTDYKLVAASPMDYHNHICQRDYNELSCSDGIDTYWVNGKCSKKELGRYSWYSYRTQCGWENLAVYDELKVFSRWLSDFMDFWIGLRCSWWTWHDSITGRSYEVINYNFDFDDLPNTSHEQCLASKTPRDGSSRPLHWINMNCSKEMQFICQQHGETTAGSDSPAKASAGGRDIMAEDDRNVKPYYLGYHEIQEIQIYDNSNKADTREMEDKDSPYMYFKDENVTTPPTMVLPSTSEFNSETSGNKADTREMEDKDSPYMYFKDENVTTPPTMVLPSTSEFNSETSDLRLELVWFGGASSLAVIALLAVLAVQAFRRNRVKKYSLIDQPKQSLCNPEPTSGYACDNYSVNTASETVGETEVEDRKYLLDLGDSDLAY